jgi:hypothetical protein
VLPDAAPGTSPGTLARKLSRCKEGMAWFLPSRYKVGRALRVSRYKFNASHIFIPGNEFYALQWSGCTVRVKRATGVWVCQALRSCLGSRSKGKNRDEPINFIYWPCQLVFLFFDHHVDLTLFIFDILIWIYQAITGFFLLSLFVVNQTI